MSVFSFMITGPEGVGKKSAIQLLSDKYYSKDENPTDELSFGCVSLLNGESIRFYSTEGQEHSRRQWERIAKKALGLVILLDNTRLDPISDLSISVQNFAELIQRTGFVVGVTNLDKTRHFSLGDYRTFLKYIGLYGPVIEVNPSQKSDMVALMDVLMAELEYTDLLYSKA